MSYEPMSIAEKEGLGHISIAWYEALLVGNPAPSVRATLIRASMPQAGDWVMETTTIRGLLRRPQNPERAALWDGQFTRYLRTEIKTHICPAEEGEIPETWDEEVYVCENPDGTEFHWTNATLIAVPLYGGFVNPMTGEVDR